LVTALQKVSSRPKVLINASAVGYYGDAASKSLDENSPAGRGFLAELCAEWEKEALKASASGVRTVCLRLGAVLGRDGGMLARLAPMFRRGLGGPLGSGKQWVSWISREDLGSLVAHILRAEVSGPLNAVAPEPVTNREFSAALGEVLGRPSWLRVPGLGLRLALGEMAGMLLGGQKAYPRKAVGSKFTFKYPVLDAALRAELL
jgi:uncharacterized protein (TIGR01777 family)